jgi:hypothetical protein
MYCLLSNHHSRWPVAMHFLEHVPSTVSTCYEGLQAIPASTRYEAVFIVSTGYVGPTRVSRLYRPRTCFPPIQATYLFPASTRYIAVFPVSTGYVPACIALVRKVVAAEDSSTAPPPSCRPWFSMCTPTLHPTTTHPQPPSG